jgi:hypothetical protein
VIGSLRVDVDYVGRRITDEENAPREAASEDDLAGCIRGTRRHAASIGDGVRLRRVPAVKHAVAAHCRRGTQPSGTSLRGGERAP